MPSLTVTNADLSPTEFRPSRRAPYIAAAVIALMAVIGLWRGISEELRVGRQSAYLETFTRTHGSPPVAQAPAGVVDAEAAPLAGTPEVSDETPPPAPEPAKAAAPAAAAPASAELAAPPEPTVPERAEQPEDSGTSPAPLVIDDLLAPDQPAPEEGEL